MVLFLMARDLEGYVTLAFAAVFAMIFFKLKQHPNANKFDLMTGA